MRLKEGGNGFAYLVDGLIYIKSTAEADSVIHPPGTMKCDFANLFIMSVSRDEPVWGTD